MPGKTNCPLYVDNAVYHHEAVKRAAREAHERYMRDHPDADAAMYTSMADAVVDSVSAPACRS